ncbi:MAG: NADH-quinone oxidoreductase subunit NuoE [Rickettsiales bacterium]
MDTDFEFTKENHKLAKEEVAKYPAGKQKSAVMGLLHIAQDQNGGWLTAECIDYIAKYLEMPPIKVYEIATFYTMYNLKPVGKFHIQVCGTTPCMLRGAKKIVEFCKEEIGIEVGQTDAKKLFTLSEVECLGGCANAPVVQINNDYYEDLSPESFKKILEDLKSGKKVQIGSQTGRKSSEPRGYKA